MASSCCRRPGIPGPGAGRRRSLRQVVADRRAARASRHPDAPGWPSGWPTANNRSTCTPSAPGRARWASGGWPRRCAPGRPTTTRRPPARTLATRGGVGARPAGPGARPPGRLRRQLADLPRARRPHPPDLRLDGAATATRRALAAAGPRPRPGARRPRGSLTLWLSASTCGSSRAPIAVEGHRDDPSLARRCWSRGSSLPRRRAVARGPKASVWGRAASSRLVVGPLEDPLHMVGPGSPAPLVPE
jgi:hypothetical protein